MRTKVISIFLVFVFSCISFSTFSQVKGQYEQLSSFTEGQLFFGYTVKKKGNEYETSLNSYSGRTPKYKLQFVSNLHGKRCGFSLQDTEVANKNILAISAKIPNHYTQPSAFLQAVKQKVEALSKEVMIPNYGGDFTVVIDGLVYEVRSVIKSEFVDPSDFKITNVYALTGKKAGEKKKMSLKEKLKAAKEAVKSGGVPESVRSRDHYKVVKDYLVAMETVQAQATQKFTAEIRNEVNAIDEAIMLYYKEVKDVNDEFWASEEGQWHLKQWSKKPIVLVNDTGVKLGICYGQGVSEWLAPGESKEFDCGSSVSRGYAKGGTSQLDCKEELISIGSSAPECGTTINASSVIK